MSSVNVPEYIYDVLGRISAENGFNDPCVQIERSTVSGYGSDMYSIKISENDSDNVLEILCKLAPAEADRRIVCNSQTSFEREAMFHNEVVPMLMSFQEEKNLPKADQFRSFPKCYATVVDDEHENYAILMEDLRPLNFKVWNKPNSLPLEHLRLSMRELGKFHGISFALKDQKPVEFARFKKLSDTLRTFFQSESVQTLMENSFDLAIESLESDQHKNVIRDVKLNFMSYLEDSVNNETSKRFGVISHGDFHNNNILYRLDENGLADDIRIMDWQTVRYVSPVLDILNSIFPSTEKSLRDNNLNDLLEVYHNSLSRTIRLLGSDPDKLFTLEDMHNEMKRCKKYALILAPLFTQLYQTDLMSTATEKTFDKMSSDLNNADQLSYNHRINDVIGDIVSFEFGHKCNETQ